MGYKDDFRRIERMAGRLHELKGFADVIYRDADRLDELFDWEGWNSKEAKSLIQEEADYLIDVALDALYKALKRLGEAGLLLRHKGGAFGAITVGKPDGKRYPDWQEPCIQWEQYSLRHGKFWKVDEDDRPLGRGMFGQR